MITFGYIDPGTGGVVLQLLMAVIVGAVYRFRRLIGRLWKAVRGKKDPPSATGG